MTDGTEKCNPKIEENQREDRRAFRKFIVLLLVSMVVGGITGAFSTMAAKGQADIGAGITAGLQRSHLCKSCDRGSSGCVDDRNASRQQSRIQALGRRGRAVDRKDRAETGHWCDCHECGAHCRIFLFAAGMKSTGIDSGWEEEIPWVKIAATFLGLIAVMVVTVTAQNRIVNFTKEINPEKKGAFTI